MIFIFETQRIGAIDEIDGVRVVTEFACLNRVPIVPQRSLLEVTTKEGDVEVPLPLQSLSIAAAYLRALGVVGVLAAVAGALLNMRSGAAITYIAVAFAFSVFELWALKIGVRSPDEHAQMRVYAEFAGYPIDVARLGEEEAARVRAALMRAMDERAPALLLPATYRTAPEKMGDWVAIACDPTMKDDGYLRAAFTLARLDQTRARGEARARLSRTHEAIWAKLRP